MLERLRRAGRARRATGIALSAVQLLSRTERLERWAELLDRDPERKLTVTSPSWCMSPAQRQRPLVEGSALHIAFDDPVFRLAGLNGTTFNDAVAFFQLSDEDADRILAGSRGIVARSARDTSHRLRNVADKTHERALFRAALLFSLALAIVLIIAHR